MDLSPHELIPLLFHKVDLMADGALVAKLNEREAANLCRLEMVEGVVWMRKVAGTKQKEPVLRYLRATVTVRKLRTVLGRIGVRSGQTVADDCRTVTRTEFGIFHDRRKCASYAGGPARLGVVVEA